MPLIKSNSKQAFKSNVAEMVKAGHPQDQALAAAYSIKRKYAEGGSVSDRMISDLMAKRKKKLEPDQDFNTEPDLREDSSSLSNSTLFDDLDSTEQGRPDAEESMYAEGGIAYNPNLKENYQDDTPEEHNETSYSEPAGDYSVDRNPEREAYSSSEAYAKGGEAKLGSGKRFEHLEKSIAAKGNVSDPAAVAASIGREKYGNKKFQKLAAAGKHADGGPVSSTPSPTQSAQDSMRKAFGYAEGGETASAADPKIPQARSYVQYGDTMHDSEGNDKPHHDSLPQGSGQEDAFYKPKAIGNQGRQSIDLNMYAPGGRVKMAYGQGRTEIDQEDTPEQKVDEMSTHAMAEGGTVDSERHLRPDYQDRKQDHDEDSGIAMAGGGSVTHAVTLEPDDTDLPQQHNEDDASHNTEPSDSDYGADTDPEREAYYADGGSVDHERHLAADDTDTPESKDEHSDIAMHDGGGVPYDSSAKPKSKSPISIHDPLDHSDNQTPPANPKSHELEKKSKRRKMMIASLNE